MFHISLTFDGFSIFASLILLMSRIPRGRLFAFLVRRFPARCSIKSSSSSSLRESLIQSIKQKN